MARRYAITAEQELPAANGLKIFNNALYVSNTEKQHIVRIPILEDAQPGEPTIFIDRVNIDDFAFDRTNIYVVSNGGMSYPLPSGIESAKVVCLEIGTEGLPLI